MSNPDRATEQPEVLTVDETARLLRISRGLAFTAVRDGTLPSIRIGRRILVPRQALHDWVSRSCRTTSGSASRLRAGPA